MSDDNSMAYLGIKSCGCAVAITTGDIKDMAKDVERYIREGYHVELTNIKDGRVRLSRCFHKEEK